MILRTCDLNIKINIKYLIIKYLNLKYKNKIPDSIIYFLLVNFSKNFFKFWTFYLEYFLRERERERIKGEESAEIWDAVYK